MKHDKVDRAEATSRDDKARQAFWTLALFICIGAIGIIVYSFCASPQGWCNTLSVGLLVALASLSTGGFFGFLFGMPRAVTAGGKDGNHPLPASSDAQISPSSESRIRPNTNLEEISDWLTKILVGAGLTQLGKMGPKLGELSVFLAAGMNGGTSGQSFVAAEVIFFGISGFLAAFLWVRLYMGKAIQIADDSVQAVKQQLQETGQKLKEIDEKQQAEIEQAKATVKQLVQGGVEEVIENPLLSEQLGPQQRAQMEVAAKFVESEPAASRTAKDYLILAYGAFQKADYKAAAEMAEKALNASPPKDMLWKIYNLLGLSYHWQQPRDWQQGGAMTWFDKAIQSYEEAVKNRTTLAEELLAKANEAFVFLDANRYADCERKAQEVITSEAKGEGKVAEICDLARIVAAAARIMQGDTSGAETMLNSTRNISSFEYLFNGEDLPTEAIKRFAGLPGLRDDVKTFIVHAAKSVF